ncbi:MAG: ABC transporter ATP-binding protein [Spirochaetales bacterium]
MEIRITGLRKHFVSEGTFVKALDDVDLTIPANHIFTLLGPSGCGKTTLLRCIVGLETPDAGEIRIGDEVVFSSQKGIFVPVEKRGLGMVFQTYAIWPHMTVFDNIAYPLQVRKVPQEEIKKQVSKVLSFVQLEGFEKRPATKLSGGQQQRVALARALVAEPKVILFDEPLSNLDAKLREETRKELKKFLTELQITAVYVTHDRLEALALSNLIAVMRQGKIIDIGSPHHMYFKTKNKFVADFMGRANLIPGTIQEHSSGTTVVRTELGLVRCPEESYSVGSPVLVCLRPEFITVLNPKVQTTVNPNTHNLLEGGKLETLLFIGDAFEGEISLKEQKFIVRINLEETFAEGDAVSLRIPVQHTFLVGLED